MTIVIVAAVAPVIDSDTVRVLSSLGSPFSVVMVSVDSDDQGHPNHVRAV